jgi:hypothetical protein
MTWTVPRDWPGETCFLLGGGPSLRGFDASILAGHRVIAINNSWELAPTADALYFCDGGWWRTHGHRAAAGFKGEHIVTLSDIRHPAVKNIRNAGRVALSTIPHRLAHGSNSGYQAINLAFLFGATRIVLLGYDMKVQPGRTHWHAGHGKDDHTQSHVLATFAKHFPRLVEPLRAAGVEVLNATPDSALTCWPFRHLSDILNRPPGNARTFTPSLHGIVETTV